MDSKLVWRLIKSMRFLHTADWHLGRLFFGVHLTSDQAHLLDQFVNLVKNSRVDAVVIAGDVYDRAVPPPDAVCLLDDVLSRIAVGLNIPVLMIAGNHDSPERLNFGSRVFSQQKVHLAGTLDQQSRAVVLNDKHGPVHFHLVPYAEPAVIREKFSTDSAMDHASGMQFLMDDLRSRHPSGTRSVVVAHAFTVGGEETDSERPLSVGGSGAVDARCFQGFDYVALGHLHRQQNTDTGKVIYSGSLMKYSFAEAEHKKCILLVDMDEQGRTKTEQLSLSPLRDLRRISGTIADLLRNPNNGGSKDDYLEVTLLDKGAILDPMGRLRQVYPNVLHLQRPDMLETSTRPSAEPKTSRVSEVDLFKDFYSEVTGDALSEDQLTAYQSVVEKLKSRDREGQA
jgi:DNA repair protein SbcD/Mre11